MPNLLSEDAKTKVVDTILALPDDLVKQVSVEEGLVISNIGPFDNAAAFRANTLQFICPAEGLSNILPSHTAFAFVSNMNTEGDRFIASTMMSNNSLGGHALIGDKNNIIDGENGKKISELFAERALGLRPREGSDPADPQLTKVIRSFVQTYCGPGF